LNIFLPLVVVDDHQYPTKSGQKVNILLHLRNYYYKLSLAIKMNDKFFVILAENVKKIQQKKTLFFAFLSKF
jgi:hypothetical protein